MLLVISDSDSKPSFSSSFSWEGNLSTLVDPVNDEESEEGFKEYTYALEQTIVAPKTNMELIVPSWKMRLETKQDNTIEADAAKPIDRTRHSIQEKNQIKNMM